MRSFYFNTRILIITLTFLQGMNLSCFGQSWLWAKSAGGTGGDYGNSIGADPGGNILVTGIFYSSAITFGANTLTKASGDYGDFFIVKYDVNGNVVWAKRAGGTENDSGNSLCTDSGGNIFVTGYFRSPTITFGTILLTNVGGDDIFIVKYGPSGNVLWAKNIGGNSSDYSISCATDSEGNVFITGYFISPTITFGTITLTKTSSMDIFIVKYDAIGNVQWAKSSGGSSSGYSIGADTGGNIFVTGQFHDPTITFGTTTLTNVSSNNEDFFIVKYDVNGNVLWAKSAGGTRYDYGNSLCTDSGGNIFVTGTFYSSTITFGANTLTNSGSNTPDIFIVKYDANGSVLWATSVGGTNYEFGSSISADLSGNAYVTSRFYSSSITLGTTTLNNNGSYDFFIAKYNATGNIVWAIRAGGTDYDYSNSISAIVGGNVLITGSFNSPTITFGTTLLINTISDTSDIFVANLGGLVDIEKNIDSDSKIKLYPNPVSTKLYIEYAEDYLPYTVCEFVFYDLLGNEQLKRDVTSKFFSNITELDVSDLPCGVYIVKVCDGKDVAVKKMIKQ